MKTLRRAIYPHWGGLFCLYLLRLPRHLEPGFLQIGLRSILPASEHFNSESAVTGLHHSSLPSCPHHPHLHTSQTPLPQLHTCGVAVEDLRRMLCSLSKAVGHSELTCIDAFATFLLLSYVTFLSVSFDILMPTFSWDLESKIQPPVVYYDGYFGQHHLPYSLLAIAVLLVFTFSPSSSCVSILVAAFRGS